MVAPPKSIASSDRIVPYNVAVATLAAVKVSWPISASLIWTLPSVTVPFAVKTKAKAPFMSEVWPKRISPAVLTPARTAPVFMVTGAVRVTRSVPLKSTSAPAARLVSMFPPRLTSLAFTVRAVNSSPAPAPTVSPNVTVPLGALAVKVNAPVTVLWKSTLSLALPTMVLATRVTTPTKTTSLFVPTTSPAIDDVPDTFTPPPPEIFVPTSSSITRLPFMSIAPVPVVTIVPTWRLLPRFMVVAVKSISPFTPVTDAANV